MPSRGFAGRRLGQPLGHRLDGRLLGYDEARRLIYLPAYRWMLDHRAAGLVDRLRELASRQTVVLLDYTVNDDITDLSTPLSHAALIAQHIEAPTHAGPPKPAVDEMQPSDRSVPVNGQARADKRR